MAYPSVVVGGATSITTVDCHKQVRSWRLLRSLLQLLIPACSCTGFVPKHYSKEEEEEDTIYHHYRGHPNSPLTPLSNTTVTGTIFGSRKGRVNFCIQTNPKSANPTLLLELAISTTSLAQEMRGGNLRLVLKCKGQPVPETGEPSTLLAMPVWTMYCNGRKVGFAARQKPSRVHSEVLCHMEDVKVGAGVVRGKELENKEDVMYLRGNFKRVGSVSGQSEKFHLIDPDGNVGQELSIVFVQKN